MCRASRMVATQYYYTPRCTQNLQCHLPHASGRASCSGAWSPGLMYGFWSGNGHKILCSLMHATLARRAGQPRPLWLLRLLQLQRLLQQLNLQQKHFKCKIPGCMLHTFRGQSLRFPSSSALDFLYPFSVLFQLTHASFAATHLQQSLSNITQDLLKTKQCCISLWQINGRWFAKTFPLILGYFVASVTYFNPVESAVCQLHMVKEVFLFVLTTSRHPSPSDSYN